MITHHCSEYVPCISAVQYNNVLGEGHDTGVLANYTINTSVRLSPVENFESEIAMFPLLFGSLLQSVMHNSTGESLTKYP